MTVQQVYCDKKDLYYIYNKSFDILDVYIVKNVVAISDEIETGVYVHYNKADDTVIGITIEDYKNRKDLNEINKIIPIRLDFGYINLQI